MATYKFQYRLMAMWKVEANSRNEAWEKFSETEWEQITAESTLPEFFGEVDTVLRQDGRRFAASEVTNEADETIREGESQRRGRILDQLKNWSWLSCDRLSVITGVPLKTLTQDLKFLEERVGSVRRLADESGAGRGEGAARFSAI